MLLYIGIYVSANFRYCDTSELEKNKHYSAKLQSMEVYGRHCIHRTHVTLLKLSYYFLTFSQITS